MATLTAPCDWPLIYTCADSEVPDSSGCEHLDSLPAEAREQIEQAAVDYLWNWTGQRYSTCETTLRPCRQECAQADTTFWGGGGSTLVNGRSPFMPTIINGDWYNIGCGTCGDTCGCSKTEALTLPGPVDSIVQVQIDGMFLDPTAYRVDNYKSLVRMDGGAWPTCQNMNLPDGEDGTWSITYLRGVTVPAGGQIAAGRLACELARAACGDKGCQLPSRVQTITRQGVTIAMLDAFDDIDKGHTGIWVIDSWIASVVQRPRRWSVYSPDRTHPTAGRTRTA